jgi:hypothetical protein
MNHRDRTRMVAALGLAVITLAGCLMDYFPWSVGGVVLVAALAAAYWFWRRGAMGPEAGAAGPKIESGLRIVEKVLPAKPRLAHGLRVTISTEVAVNLGLRVVCDGNIHEVEALAQTGRGTNARQGLPAAVREGRRAWLFVVRNSPVQRELFLRVDLYSAQPLHLEAVELIRAGGAVALPEWRELEPGLGAAAGDAAPGGLPVIPAASAVPAAAATAALAAVAAVAAVVALPPPDADAAPIPEALPAAEVAPPVDAAPALPNAGVPPSPPLAPPASAPPDTELSNPLP